MRCWSSGSWPVASCELRVGKRLQATQGFTGRREPRPQGSGPESGMGTGHGGCRKSCAALLHLVASVGRCWFGPGSSVGAQIKRRRKLRQPRGGGLGQNELC
jgi:hypothetical protein